MNKAEAHYDENYFNSYQKASGEFGGKANLFLFEEFVHSDHSVLDFGCGGGFLLRNLNCKNRIGVELNPIAREFCINEGTICYSTLDEVENDSLDLIISSHCLEHTLAPQPLVEKMYNKLKSNGRIVIVVPLDSYRQQWKKNDIDYHLYSFSPLNLGNLLDSAGFEEINTHSILHKWPPKYSSIQKTFGWKVFHLLSKMYGQFDRGNVQVRGTGIKK